MYSRYPNYRFSGGVRVPENYSGNAFSASEDKDDKIIESDLTEEAPKTPTETVSEAAAEGRGDETAETFKPVQKGFRLPGFKFDIGKIFSGGFGFEELLIIGLILLISQNGKGDDDIILLLALLLFIG